MVRHLALPILLLTPIFAHGQQTILPIIANVLDNPAGTQITINGQGFGYGRPQISLSGQSLTVISSTDTSVLATIPAGVTPGTYVVSVQNSSTHLAGLFPAEIGPSLGVAGATGLAGPQGLPGPQGPQGRRV